MTRGARTPKVGPIAEVQAAKDPAVSALMTTLYTELRRLARQKLARERPGQTLQPTDLVHEAYVRLAAGANSSWANRAQFFAAAAITMRRILVERARRRSARKHGAGGRTWISLDGQAAPSAPAPIDLLALDEVLTRLENHDKRMSEIVMLRYFAGLDVEETASTLGISTRTVKREWSFAKAWLHEEMQGRA